MNDGIPREIRKLKVSDVWLFVFEHLLPLLFGIGLKRRVEFDQPSTVMLNPFKMVFHRYRRRAKDTAHAKLRKCTRGCFSFEHMVLVQMPGQ